MKLGLISALLLIFMIFSCRESEKTVVSTDGVNFSEAEHTSKNSLDWAGIYETVLPCADCEGIKSKLTLESDDSFLFEEEYLGKDTTIFVTKGTYEWEDNGNYITYFKYGHKERLKVEEGRLVLKFEEGIRSSDLIIYYKK